MRKKVVKNTEQFRVTNYDENAIGQPTVEVSDADGNYWYWTRTNKGEWVISFINAKEGSNAEKSAMQSLVKKWWKLPSIQRHYRKNGSEAKTLAELKDKIKAYPSGMPIDQFTAKEKRLLRKHSEWFEDNDGYIHVLKEKLSMQSAYRNGNRRDLTSQYKARYGITGRMTKDDARQIAEIYNIDLNGDFHSLNFDEQSTLNDLAIITGYRKSKSASGSLAREFFKSLSRGRASNSSRDIEKGKRGEYLIRYITKDGNYEYKFWTTGTLTANDASFTAAVNAPKWVTDNEGNIKSGVVIEFWRLNPRKLLKRIRNPKRNSKQSGIYNEDKLDELSGMFQGTINGGEIQTYGSDYTPPITGRLGKLTYIKIKNGQQIFEGNFGKDAWLSMDARKNLYTEGRGARIWNVELPPKGVLWHVGTVLQGNYITKKRHIENGRKTEFYHELGEVDGICPNAFLDHDGFLILVGGNYDIGVHGIEN